jgi:RHS repeat-associated protein
MSAGRDYAYDEVPPQFTGKERDAETGLDYFGARYYAWTLGRFLAVDPSRLSIEKSNPQTWNRYVYTRNDPLNRIDSNGKWDTPTHNWIISTGLTMLSNNDRAILMRASAFVDSLPYQQAEWAHLHGTTMAGLGFDIGLEQAESLAAASIDKQLENATRLQVHWESLGQAGFDPAALFVFGLAVHNVADARAHEFSNWRGLGPSLGSFGPMTAVTAAVNLAGAAIHGLREKATGAWQRSSEARLGEALYQARLDVIRLYARWIKQLEEARRKKQEEEAKKKKKEEKE